MRSCLRGRGSKDHPPLSTDRDNRVIVTREGFSFVDSVKLELPLSTRRPYATLAIERLLMVKGVRHSWDGRQGPSNGGASATSPVLTIFGVESHSNIPRGLLLQVIALAGTTPVKRNVFEGRHVDIDGERV